MITVKNKFRTALIAFFAVALIGFTTSCSDDDDTTPTPPPALERTPSEILVAVTWKTTLVETLDGEDVTESNNGYVGYADYNMDGTFEIRGFDNVVRSSGTWAVTADGKKRILVTPAFARVVDILVLDKDLFTYQITNPAGIVVNVEHVPVKNKNI